MASTIPQRSSRPPLTSAPPSGPLPALPVARARKALPDIPDQSESRPTTSGSNVSSSTIATTQNARSVTSSGLPTPRPSKTISSPAVPTLNTSVVNDATTSTGSQSAVSPPSSAIPTPGKTLRKTTSIGQFPLPPQVAKQQRVSSLPPSPLSTTTDANGLSKEKAKRDSNNNRISEGGGGARRSKTRSSGYGLRPRASNASLIGSASSPSLLNGTGESNLVATATSGVRVSDTSLSSRGARDSTRSSSVNGSYQTDGTSFDDDDQHLEGITRGRRKSTETLTDKTNGKDSKGNVIVSVRVRPDANARGHDDGEIQAEGEWLVDGRRSLISYRGREGGEYRYDNVFSPHDHNARVYDHSAKRLVRRVMEGYNGTVFAYGMTGTGKTYSMQGIKDSPGVIPLAIADIFSYIREKPDREFLLRVTYLEIYNEKIFDLLKKDGSPAQEEIKLREDSKRGVYADPLNEEVVQSPNQLLRMIARGDAARRTAGTQFNARSSRSHAVVQIIVESRERSSSAPTAGSGKNALASGGGVLISTLSLIDLAGSEKAADNKERRTEGAHINKSLLTLGTVIAKLSGDEEKEKADGTTTPGKSEAAKEKALKHLPYRDSKLTRLLQPALSGNSLVSILCTIQLSSAGTSAASIGQHTGETLGTLKFASRAKNNIVSRAKRNESHAYAGGDQEIRTKMDEYRLEIQGLRAMLAKQSKARREEDGEKRAEDDEEAEKDRAVEKELERQERARREEQMNDMAMARTALEQRISHLNQVILSSRSVGVNSRSIRPPSASTLVGGYRVSGASAMDFSRPVSVRSRDSQYSAATSPSGRNSSATLDARRPSLGGRSISTGSTTTPGPGQRSSATTPISPLAGDDESILQQPDDETEIEDETDDPTVTLDTHGAAAADGEASLAQQNRMLQADLADKNRYIATLEKRLLQARRTSHSRVSMQFSSRSAGVSAYEDAPGAAAFERVVGEKDREIEDLRARLDDQVRMVNALRSAARKTAMFEPPSSLYSTRRSLAAESTVSSSDDTARPGSVVDGTSSGAGAGTVARASIRNSRESSRTSLRNSQQQHHRLTNGTTTTASSSPRQASRSLSNASRSSPTTTNTSASSVTAAAGNTANGVAAAANRPPYNRLPPTPLSPIALLSPSEGEKDGETSKFSEFPAVPNTTSNQPQANNNDAPTPTSPTKPSSTQPSTAAPTAAASTSQGARTSGSLPSSRRTSQQTRRRSVDEMTQLLDQMIQDKVESGQVLRSSHGSLRIATNTTTSNPNSNTAPNGSIGLGITSPSTKASGPSGAPPRSPPPPLPVSVSAAGLLSGASRVGWVNGNGGGGSGIGSASALGAGAGRRRKSRGGSGDAGAVTEKIVAATTSSTATTPGDGEGEGEVADGGEVGVALGGHEAADEAMRMALMGVDDPGEEEERDVAVSDA